jgi:hypothetical protein
MLQQNPTIKSSNEHSLSIEKETKTRDATDVRQNRIGCKKKKKKKDSRKNKRGLSATRRRKAGNKQKQTKPKKPTYY